METSDLWGKSTRNSPVIHQKISAPGEDLLDSVSVIIATFFLSDDHNLH